MLAPLPYLTPAVFWYHASQHISFTSCFSKVPVLRTGACCVAVSTVTEPESRFMPLRLFACSVVLTILP